MTTDTNEYNEYLINGEYKRLKFCEKPDCDRLTSALYCCGPCDVADQHKCEIGEKGSPLGHTDSCDARYEERKHLARKW